MNADLSGLRGGDWRGFAHVDLTKRIIACFSETYNELGGGFLEPIYREALALVLESRGLHAARELSLPVRFRGRLIGNFRADFLVEGSIVVEVKAVRAIEQVHVAQLLNYLRASELEVGLLLDFGARPLIRRLVYSTRRR